MNDTNQSTGNVTAINIYGAVNTNSSHNDSGKPIKISTKGIKRAVCILYVLVLMLSVWVAYICYCDLQFDANNTAGIIVSVLGAIITLLVGWQVFNAIEVRNIIKTADTIKYRLYQQEQELESKTKSLEWLISALHGEAYKRKDFKNDTEYFLHCLDVIGCFIKSGAKSDNPPFNRSMEELEMTLKRIIDNKDKTEVLFMGGNKDFVRNWYHEAVHIIDTEANNLDSIKSRLTIIYEDYITLTKDVKMYPHKKTKQ